ncbi:tRNA (adenosine(37)-N6)-threonylcarbamoyltransferase complex dimerization subunit type 1 TsaB [Candidatus Steffania adelgidicola]|uniref:tRNA (adenosine(37)-N6)-threonylcarbamoyltransferase complex dimerization subunit type 1 TsaB n=1 Tax=Candidatus Steffania adelgidicola TaxID=1076626 RepID=UPI001D02CCAB|nr:tRNA (adenosine(37)-N6)-threonylcarbamoyltransferase complex dimerization subunit type 1 TsaB [Candidatus Steffania adelgidicola]UDG80214.1 tRNA threonylcarbamoyladenosine biosynthesis protein TsaB [Candidatus Steffania adelgidicola]
MSTRILAIDTATEACSAALMLENDVLLERFVIAPQEHTQHILPMIDSLLVEADILLKHLDVLAFGRGPGSFTGIRIGISIAQGLALGANLPVIGISTLATLAEGTFRQTRMCQVMSAIDARMGELYLAPYRRQGLGVWLGEDHEVVVSIDSLPAVSAELQGLWITAGTGWQSDLTQLHHDGFILTKGPTRFPSARDMLPLALCLYRHGLAQPVSLATPTYLRNTVT